PRTRAEFIMRATRIGHGRGARRGCRDKRPMSEITSTAAIPGRPGGTSTASCQSQRVRLSIAAAVLAGAMLVAFASGCGGVLGAAVSDKVKASVPLGCAIQHANRENDVYFGALDIATGNSTTKFHGFKTDDLSVNANRRRIFGARLAELDKNAGLAASDEGALNDEERQILSAMRDDLAATRILMHYDMRWAPGDRKAPLLTEVATNLSAQV